MSMMVSQITEDSMVCSSTCCAAHKSYIKAPSYWSLVKDESPSPEGSVKRKVFSCVVVLLYLSVVYASCDDNWRRGLRHNQESTSWCHIDSRASVQECRWFDYEIYEYGQVFEHMAPGSKVHLANIWTIWDRQDPGSPHVGPMNHVIWGQAFVSKRGLTCTGNLYIMLLASMVIRFTLSMYWMYLYLSIHMQLFMMTDNINRYG